MSLNWSTANSNSYTYSSNSFLYNIKHMSDAIDSATHAITGFMEPDNRMTEEKEGLVRDVDLVRDETAKFLEDATNDGFTGPIEYKKNSDGTIKAVLYGDDGKVVGTFQVHLEVERIDGLNSQWMKKLVEVI
jgi:hypothetical protein